MTRKKYYYHYLYKTTNLINGKYYYGIHSTSNLNDNYLGSGKRLRYSIRKYGAENFKREILEFFDNREDLVQAEIELITEEMLLEPMCMNLKPGGSGGLGGMVTVKDNDGKCFNVFKDDPRYLSGEVKSVATNRVCIIDNDGKKHSIFRNDIRYLSNEFVSIFKNKVNVKDKNDKIFQVSVDDPRYLSGELIHLTKGHLNVKDKNGNILKVSIDDPRYLSGELVSIWKDKKHNVETKEKMSKKAKERVGNKNSQFGTCWITNNIENKKIKKEELELFILQGWSKGRKLKR